MTTKCKKKKSSCQEQLRNLSWKMCRPTSLCCDVVLVMLLVHCGIAQGIIYGSGYVSGSGYPYSGSNNDPSDTPPVVTCPDSCNCIGPSMVRCDGRRDVEILSFRGLELTEVPNFQGNFPDLKMIDLNNNRIRIIRSGAFTSLNLPELENLVLANNAIENVEVGALQLNKLSSLDLSNNFLETLREDAFQIILSDDFSTFDLNNNRIRIIRSGAFTSLNLPELENLVLANNAIENVEVGALQLNELSFLDLSNNFLETLREDAFQILSDDFSTLILQNNMLINVEFSPSLLTRDNLPYLFIFVAGNPLPCNRIEPLASSPAIVALCIGGFFGSDLATCIFETPTTFEELPIEAFCNLVYEELTQSTTEPSIATTETTVVSTSSSMNTIVAIGASIGGVVALVVLVLCTVCLVLLCIRLKKWEKKFDEVAIQNAERNLQLEHTLNPYRPSEQLSPRYARGPIASLPPLPGDPPKKLVDNFFPALPGVIPKIPPGGPPKVPLGTIPRQFQNNTYDPNSEEIYEHIDERPLPSLPDEVEYGDNYYILNVASIPQKSPSSTCAPSPVAEKKIVQAEINYPPPSKTAAPIESDHESDDESAASGTITTTKTVDNTQTQTVDKGPDEHQTKNSGGIQQAGEKDKVEDKLYHTANEEVGLKSPKYINTGSSWATKKEFVPKVGANEELGLIKIEKDVSEADKEEQEVAYLSVVL